MTEAQIWAALGILATALLGTIAALTAQINRTIMAQFEGLRTEMVVRFEKVDEQFEGFRREVDARFDAVDARFNAVDVRFDAIERRVDHLDRDVQAITRRFFGTEPRD